MGVRVPLSAPSFSMKLQIDRRIGGVALSVVAGAALAPWLGLVPPTEVLAQRKAEAEKKFDLRAMLPDPISRDAPGFTAIFDGQSLDGWDGDPAFWRAENGLIVGESTAAKPLARNTFLIWRGGKPGDFELKLEYRINSTNSGVQYRSKELPDVGPWVLKGYQADIDAENRFTGQIYEERGRGFLALRGQFTHIASGKKARVVGEIGDGGALKSLIKVNDWNSLHLIARGNALLQVLNDQVMSMAIDDDKTHRRMEGLIGIQLHSGPPMKIEVRGVMLKNL